MVCRVLFDESPWIPTWSLVLILRGGRQGTPVWDLKAQQMKSATYLSILDLWKKYKWQNSSKSWDLSKNALKPVTFQISNVLDCSFKNCSSRIVRLLLFHNKYSNLSGLEGLTTFSMSSLLSYNNGKFCHLGTTFEMMSLSDDFYKFIIKWQQIKSCH